MTVWGLLSDIHGNYPALDLGLRLLQREGVTRLAFLGDYLGRGDSDRCVACIREVADVAIVGNRDLDWQDRVSAATKTWVLSLPRTAHDAELLVSHGDSRLTPGLSTAQIARDFVKPWAALEDVGASIWAFGHSHHARTWRKVGAARAAEALPLDAAVAEEGRYFVNVGTTGLPFPGKGGPSVAIVDMLTRRIRHLALSQG